MLFLSGKGNVWKGYNNERFGWVNRNFSINFWNNETRGYVLKYFLCQIWDKLKILITVLVNVGKVWP